MANVPEAKTKANVDLPHVTINANGTDYKISAFLFNNRGEVKFADSNTFNKVVFESSSRNTYESAVLSKKIINPKKDNNINAYT